MKKFHIKWLFSLTIIKIKNSFSNLYLKLPIGVTQICISLKFKQCVAKSVIND